MGLPNGQTFGTAKGNLTFREFGQLVSETWSKGYPDINMYPSGTPTDDLTYPCLVWSCAGKVISDSRAPRLVDEFIDDEGVARGKYLQTFTTLFEVKIRARDAEQANQLVEHFERFMLEFVSVFKKAGMGDVKYLRRDADEIDSADKSNVVIRTVVYELKEQYTYTIKDYIIESIEARVTVDAGDDTATEDIISTVT